MLIQFSSPDKRIARFPFFVRPNNVGSCCVINIVIKEILIANCNVINRKNADDNILLALVV